MEMNNEELLKSLDKAKKDIIKEAKESNLNIEPLYLNPKFTIQQMREIRNGIKHNIDVLSYALPEYEWKTMAMHKKSLKKRV